MSCHHCVATIEKALYALPGVQGVKIDLAAKRVEVLFAPERVSTGDIRHAIVDAGYEVQGVL